MVKNPKQRSSLSRAQQMIGFKTLLVCIEQKRKTNVAFRRKSQTETSDICRKGDENMYLLKVKTWAELNWLREQTKTTDAEQNKNI